MRLRAMLLLVSHYTYLYDIRATAKKRLAPWTHNKTIQKAIESYRITPEPKQHLQTLKIK